MNPCIVALGALVAFWLIVAAVLVSVFGMETVIRFGIAMSVVIFAAAFVRAFGEAFVVGRFKSKREVAK